MSRDLAGRFRLPGVAVQLQESKLTAPTGHTMRRIHLPYSIARPWFTLPPPWSPDWPPRTAYHYGIAIVVVAMTAAAMLPLRPHLDELNVGLIFLLATFMLALVAGGGPAVLAAVLSFLAFNYFFIPPYHTLSVAQGEDVLMLTVYLGIAVVTSGLVARVRTRTELALREQRRTSMLYELNAALIGDITLDAVLATIVERVVHVYRASQCRILLPEGDGLTVGARYPLSAPAGVERQALTMAQWVLDHDSAARLGTGASRVRWPHGTRLRGPVTSRHTMRNVLFLPITSAEQRLGVLEVTRRPDGGAFDDDEMAVLTSFATQAALALERARLGEEAARADVLAQSDELKSALLAAVSHELRTPLATIKTSVTSLLDDSIAWSPASRNVFLKAMDEETDRLTRMVSNLLDLSRIEAGVLRPDKEWYDVAELMTDVRERLVPLADGHHLELEIAPDLPLAHFDYVEIAQVMMILGENAIRYTPSGTSVILAARCVPGAIEMEVRDDGPGIDPDHLPRLFEPFYRAPHQQQATGTGIGLAISKGLVEAHGGQIRVESQPGAGSMFRFTIPLSTSEATAP
jgi:two-component system, OmpR family, sensor histidine kinase KdpD